MKKFLLIISLALLTPCAFSQNVAEELIRLLSQNFPEEFSRYISEENKTRFENRKKKGYFNTTQIGMLRGNTQITEGTPYYPGPWYSSISSSVYAPSYIYKTRSEMQISPSLTMTNGYMFNEHWAAGVGVGFEIFDRNHFPVFADIRYTLWDSKVSPCFAFKAGYSFGDFKKRHYENLPLPYEPYYVYNADFRNYGGLMLHPEMGVKVAISENADLLFSIAYRYQKTKTTITTIMGDYVDIVGGGSNQHWEAWDHKESLNRLSFSIAIMFR